MAIFCLIVRMFNTTPPLSDPGCSLVPSPSVAPTVSISCVRTLFPRPSDRFVAKLRPPRWQVLHAPSAGRCRRRAVLL
ncbi:hypothetical protein ACQJBY_068530 [Aegilops geniculata]